MKDFEKKILKYILILLGMFLIIFLFNTIVLTSINFHQFKDFDKTYNLFKIIPPIIIDIIFGFILYVDCRTEIRNRYLIPVLGAVLPIVGLMFYFIEKYALLKIIDNDK